LLKPVQTWRAIEPTLQVGGGRFDIVMDWGKNGLAPSSLLDPEAIQAFLLIPIDPAANRIFMLGLIEATSRNPADGPAICHFQNRGSFRPHIGERVMIAHMEQFSMLFCCQAHKSSVHYSRLPGNVNQPCCPILSLPELFC